MILEQAQVDWLTKLDSKAKAQKNLQERADMKAALLTKLLRDRQDSEDDLIKGTSQRVIKEGTKKTQKTQDYILRDQTKLFDMDDQRQGFVLGTVVKSIGKKRGKVEVEQWNKMTGEQKRFQEMQEAGRVVDSLALQMQEEVDELDDDGNPVTYEEVDQKTGKKVRKTKKVPLFSGPELKEELYTPLVRSGLIPETNVPNEFSATKEMVDGSFEGYAKRLSREKKRGLFTENKALGIAMLRGAISFSGQVQGLKAASGLPNSQLQWTPETSQGLHGLHQGFGLAANDPGATEHLANTADKAAEGYIFAQNLSDIAFDVGLEGGEAIMDKVQSGNTPSDEDPIKKASGKVGGLAIAEIATALGGALNDYGLGMSASSAFGALVKGPDVAKKIGKKDIAGAGGILANAFAETLIKLGPPNDADIVKAADKAKQAFLGALKADTIIKSLESGAFEEAASGLGAAGVAGAKEVHDDIGVMKIFSKNENADAAQVNAGRVVSAEFERDDTPKPKDEQIKEHKRAHKHTAQWVEGEHGFVCIKCPGEGEDPEFFAGMLERKIAKLEADAAIWKWITTLGGMGFDVAADFVAPLAMGGALLRLAKNAHEALKRYTDMSAFVDSRQSMLIAASAFSAPVSQFIHNSSQQFMHYSINAAMEGLKIVAAALQLGAITAPVGVGLAGGANISQAIEGVLYEAKKRWDLSTAWNTYKAALENPENRKTGLIAIKSNPTLAKYSVAWGAVILKDPLVVDFMHDCGLNKDTLKDPEANVDRVVSYLEKRMPDDNEVVGRDYSAVGKVELVATVWIKEKARGEKKLGAKAQDTKSLEYSLTQWELKYPVVKVVKDKDPADVQKCRDILRDLEGAFAQYKPFDKDGVPIQEMSDLRAKFTKRIALHKKELEAW
jgi:hypothetical protein